uniref:small monomeric GTPase n=1 Tax=Scleropages formosus TaxID=113540 RepID=A0A8C9U3G1_SCLFO
MFGKSRTLNAGLVSERPECNIAVLGVRGSGKSEDTYASEEIVDQQSVLVKIMDTADQDGPVHCERYLSWASAFLVVYSIDNRHSFDGSQQYLDILSTRNRGLKPETPIILLGNKVDMERYRQVSKSDAGAVASRYGCLFFEVSACLDYLSVQSVFHEAVREVWRESERGLVSRTLFISEEKPVVGLAPALPVTACLKELPTPTTAKLVTVKSSRAQSKRRAPTLTLLKGFKIF